MKEQRLAEIEAVIKALVGDSEAIKTLTSGDDMLYPSEEHRLMARLPDCVTELIAEVRQLRQALTEIIELPSYREDEGVTVARKALGK